MSSISTTLDILKNIELPPNIYIGGSLPLIVQNIIPYRTPKDIDLISCIPIEEHNLDHLNIKKIFRAYGFSKNNLRFELFYNPKAEFVEYDYKGHTFRFSPIYEIIEFKLKKADREITESKHLDDLKHCLSSLKTLNIY